MSNPNSENNTQPAPVKTMKACCHSGLYKATNLPIYGIHHRRHQSYEVVKQEPSILEEYVSIGRKSLEKYTGNVENAYDRVINIYETGVAHSKSTYSYVTEDASTLQRTGAIMVGGLTGLIFSFRRGFFRKVLYVGTGAGLVATICYPKEAKEAANTAVNTIKTDGFNAIKEQTGYDVNELFDWTLPKMPEFPDLRSTFSKIKEQFQGEKTKDTSKDFGQSHPEDKDLYTTRGK